MTRPSGPAFLLYNPQAGKLRKRPGLLSRAKEILEPHFGEVALIPTRGPGTAGDQARECIDQGAGVVLVAGGDGTVNEAAAGMAGSEVPLGILPAGTANVVCMETGVGGNLLRAARGLPSLEPVSVSLGLLEPDQGPPRHFLAMCGAGLDAAIVRLVRPALKHRFGKLSYWFASFGQLGKGLPEFEVTIDQNTYKVSFALAARVKNYGGDLEIARHADLLGDELAVVLFEGPSSFRYLKYFSGVVFNLLDGMRGVTLARTTEIRIRQPIDLQVDGEYAGLGPAGVRVSPERIRLLVPPAYLAATRPAAVRGIHSVSPLTAS